MERSTTLTREPEAGTSVVAILILVSLFGLAVAIGARVLSASATSTYCGQSREVAGIPSNGGGSLSTTSGCPDETVTTRRPGATTTPDDGASISGSDGDSSPPSDGPTPDNTVVAVSSRGSDVASVDVGRVRFDALEGGPLADPVWDPRTGLAYDSSSDWVDPRTGEVLTSENGWVWNPANGDVYSGDDRTYGGDDDWIDPSLAPAPELVPRRPPPSPDELAKMCEENPYGCLQPWDQSWYEYPRAAGALNGIGATAIASLMGWAGWTGAEHFARDVTVAADRPEGRDMEFVVTIVSLAVDVFTLGGRTAATGTAKVTARTGRLSDDIPASATPTRPRVPTATGTSRLSPQLRRQIDDLASEGDFVSIPNGTDKSGLIDFLRTQPIEYAVVRSADDGLIYVIRGETAWVRPRSPNDRLIFHNHPSGTPIMSGVNRSTPSQFGSADWGWIARNRPQQRSTIIGTGAGTVRTRIPRSWEMYDWDNVAGAWRRLPDGSPVTRQPRLDNLMIGGTLVRDRNTRAYLHMRDAFERGHITPAEAGRLHDILIDGTRLAPGTRLTATEATYLGLARAERVGDDIVAHLDNGTTVRFDPLPMGSLDSNPLGVRRFQVEITNAGQGPQMLDAVEVVVDGRGKILEIRTRPLETVIENSAARLPSNSQSLLDSGPGSQYRADSLDLATAELFARDINPVVMPRALAADAAALMAGGGQLVGDNLVVNTREYEIDGDGLLAPVRGPGIVELDHSSYLALGVYNQHGATPAAEAELDRLDILEATRRRALGIHDLQRSSIP